jgi:predicted MFS family arabinose efflux permease
MTAMDRNRFLNYFIYACVTCVYSLTSFFLPIFLMGLGLSGSRIGALLMIFTVTALLSSFAIGLLADRFGARGNTVCGLLLMAIFYAGLVSCRGTLALLPIFFLGGLGSNIIRITMNALFLKSHDSDRQGREIGSFNFVYQFSMGCGIIVGSLLLARMEFSALFSASAVLTLLLIGCALSLRSSPIQVAALAHYVRDLTQKRVLLFSTALALFYLHWGAEIACYSPFLKKNLGLSTSGAGLFMGLPIFFLACATFYFGLRRDRGESSIRLAVIAILASGAGLVLFAVSRHTIAAFLFRLIHEIGDAAFVIFTYVGIAQLFPRERIGGTSGSMYVVMIGAQSAGSWLFSWMGGEYGYALPHIVAGLCSLSAIPLIFRAQAHYRFVIPDKYTPPQ